MRSVTYRSITPLYASNNNLLFQPLRFAQDKLRLESSPSYPLVILEEVLLLKDDEGSGGELLPTTSRQNSLAPLLFCFFINVFYYYSSSLDFGLWYLELCIYFVFRYSDFDIQAEVIACHRYWATEVLTHPQKREGLRTLTTLCF